jgi:integrase
MGKTDDPQFVPHMLRHTCATRLSQSGVSLPVIKEWLGHTTIQTTIRYAHFNKKDLLSAAQALSK